MFKVFKTTGIEGNYSISSNPLFVSNGCWSIYPAKHKTTKKKCSVWQFSKKDFEAKLTNNGILNRSNKQLIQNDIFEGIKKYISNLAKFKHPNFLTVIEPLEDHKNRVLFVTEYVVNDLNSLDKVQLDEIIITKGLLQISEGLKFLHQSVHTAHLNINPSSILITENFDWKLSGLQFIENLENGIAEKYIDPLDSRLPKFLSIEFQFSSSNLILKHNVDYIDDLFSLGCLIYYLFNDGNHIIGCSSSSLIEYERSFNRLKHILSSNNVKDHASFANIPKNYIDIFISLLNDTQESKNDVLELRQNITIDTFIDSSIFNNELIKILNVIDGFPTLPANEKIQFLSSLRNEINNFPKVLLINKFIPILTETISPYFNNKKQLQNEDQQLIVLASENLLLLGQGLSQLSFSEKIFITLQKLLADQDIDSYKILLITHSDVIKNGLNADEKDLTSKTSVQFQKFLLLLFDKTLANSNNALPGTIQLQEKLLTNLRIFLDFQVYTTITNKIFPSICTLFSTTVSLKVKNLTIQSFILMINGMKDKNLDNYIIVEKLLPLIQNASPSNFKNSNLLLGMIELYDNLFSKLSKGASKISVNKQEVEISDLILESIFFQLWKISKFISRKSDLDSVFTILKRIETYLQRAITEHVESVEREQPQQQRQNQMSQSPVTQTHQPAAASFNNDDVDELDDFDDFQSSPAQQPTLTFQSSKAIQPIKLRKEPTISKLSFGATSSSSSSISRLQHQTTPHHTSSPSPSMAQLQQNNRSSSPTNSYSVMQPMRASRASASPTLPTSTTASLAHKQASPTNTGDSGIDWGKATTSSHTTTNNNWSSATSTPTNYTSTINAGSNWNNSSSGNNGAFGSFEPIKPTKRLNQTTTSNGNNNNNKSGTPDFFDSLI